MTSNDEQDIKVNTREVIHQAADLLPNVQACLFTAGAGTGVGSELGTFCGVAVSVCPPLLDHPHLNFNDLSNPACFRKQQGNSIKHSTADFGDRSWAYHHNAYTSAHE
jgi:hypothetical protein